MEKILFGINKTEPSFPYDWIKPGESLEIAKNLGKDSNLDYSGHTKESVLYKMEEIARQRIELGYKPIFWMYK